ncbi:uncharacterized protein CDV56_109325 [Aspergillus thermomutatus]|uniref:Uncharacterized protein n=1 Tax=Aspergillus thermomutatus TaxID=41047 RepID=A0A397HUW7_ASPTH|nr:uncharacterized protein CDV56_109325 [Aspergillus thermomutatus]RHZ65356.1 hypothetical protein CDV56_109325 [Aspergillus thermomutatus]
MTRHLARQANTCTGSKQWYVCSKGKFHGCCSVDPCNTGVCPDQENQTTLSTATTANTSKATSTTTATSPTAAITTAPSTSSQGDIPGIIASRTVTQAVAPATDTANTSPGRDHGALIGGVVGAVLALILLSGLLFLVYRSRKKHGKRFVLLSWRVTREESHEKALPVASSRGFGSGNEEQLPDGEIRRPLQTTPELSDTGFYRQRAELAAYSQSELINIPPSRRQALPAQHTDPETEQSAQPQLPSIITPDGVILGANFDYRVPGDDPYPGPGEGLSHVLSFMHFEEGGRSGEWRKSFESGTGV